MKVYDILNETWVEEYRNGEMRVAEELPDGSTKPPEYVYRVMNVDEYNQAKETGYFQPSSFYGRIHASREPDMKYQEGDSVIVQFKYHDEDGWKAKWGDKLYTVTWEPIPFDRATILS